MNAIETRNLTKRFKTKTAVEALNLTIRQGELFSLLGVNGAGKTTTIKMLSALLPPTEGEAFLLGNSVTANAQRVKADIGVSPQETAVATKLTVRENLILMAGVHGADRSTAKKRAQAVIAEFGMEELADSRAKTLSGGWQRRLSIAMALISEPKILFLDEPTLGLDVLARRELWKAISSLKGKITIVLTTHYMEEAEALSDRVGVMSAGRLRIVGTPEELIASADAKNFEDAFVRLAGGDAQ